jgi:hypothetical protein
MITPEAIAHRAMLLAQENEMTEQDAVEVLAKALCKEDLVLPDFAQRTQQHQEDYRVSARAILAALAPYFGSLAAERMKREAAEELRGLGYGTAVRTILAIPTPTEDQLDADAMARPKVANVVVQLENLLSVYQRPDERMCCDGRECGCMGATAYQEAEHFARAALRALKGAEHE